MMQSRREGFALAATILAMLVVGAIVTGGFYAASQEGQVARSTSSGDDALFIAEAGMTTTYNQANAVVLNAMALNSTRTNAATNVSVGTQVLGNYVTTVSRVADRLFVINSTGTVTRGGRYAGATHRVSSLARLRIADFDNTTAVLSYGNMNVQGNSEIDGTDFYPSSWTGVGCTTDPSSVAIITNPTTTIAVGNSAVITGDSIRTNLYPADFQVFGDLTWNDLVAMKDKTVSGTVGPAPVVAGGLCSIAVADNWGSSDPTNACYSYFPILYAPGNLNISSSSEGQGILLVEGDLDITGGFTFYGIVVVKGQIRMPGTGGHVNGTTLVYGDGNLTNTSSTRGNSLLQYSSCAIKRALINNTNLTRLVPIMHRSWMDLSAVSGGN
jgi:hypothetical protein